MRISVEKMKSSTLILLSLIGFVLVIILSITMFSSENLQVSSIIQKYEKGNVINYSIVKPDGTYSKFGINEELGITSEKIENTFTNFWVFEDTLEEFPNTLDLIEEDTLTYDNGFVETYLIYKGGYAKYSNNNNEEKVLKWTSNYID